MPATLDLAAVIARVESAGDPFALRFEPRIYQLWANSSYGPDEPLRHEIMTANKCSRETANMIASTSWGLYQLLGENLYNYGLDVSVGAFMAGADQQSYFHRFLKARRVDFTLEETVADPVKRETFIRTYNGPGDVDVYWGQMQGAIKGLGGSC